MNRKLVIVLAGLAAVAALGAYFGSPIFAFKALAEAGEKGDRGQLERLVDFPAVRADLKVQLQDRLMGALARDAGLSRGPFGALGALLGPTIVDQVVNTAVTPEGVAAIVQSGRAPLTEPGSGRALPPPVETAPPPAVASQGSPPAAPAKPKRKTRFAYQGLDHFRATTVTGDAAPLGWVMERRGLIGWKLVRIELPPA